MPLGSGRMIAGLRHLAPILIAVALLLAASALPPDTSLRDVRASGELRACLPPDHPPLATTDPERPGIDAELLAAIAAELGVAFRSVLHVGIGRDFDPSNWRLNRAQCSVIAGGVVDTPVTRGFLTVTRPHLQTGWAAVAADPALTTLAGARVGFFAGVGGLDRLALSRFLREQGANVQVLTRRTDLDAGLREGRFDAIVTEALIARGVADVVGGTAVLIPVGVPAGIGLGSWKGDVTLARAIDRALLRLHAQGVMQRLLDRYDLGAVSDRCPFCGP